MFPLTFLSIERFKRNLECARKIGLGLLLWSLQTASAQENRWDNHVDWGIYRGSNSGIQYSELDQIDADNVADLEVAWEYHHGRPEGPSMYSNPIIIDGKLLFTTPRIEAIALDAKTGEEFWRFDPSDYSNAQRPFRGRNRGVAYWDGSEKSPARVFNFVKDRVYAIDIESGNLIEGFGETGWIDLRENLPIPSNEASIEVTTPGIVYENILIVGSRVPEGNRSTPGDIRAYDAETGEFLWIFHTIPLKGEPGYETWNREPGEIYGGANPWGGFTLDAERGWVFCATGSAAGDFIYGGTRKGSNLFANCVLALDAKTGKRVWSYQTIHHDIWDYDNPPAPILATLNDPDGPSRDVAIQLTKMGLTFVLDRETGDPVFPVEERPVPPSSVPGEEAWPTQPIPTRPPSLVRTAIYETDLTRITPESHAAALQQFHKYRTGGLYTPASLTGTITTPGHQGGVEWGGAAIDPETNIMYVNVNEAPTINRLEPIEPSKKADSPESRGQQLYSQNCVFCHGLNRQGVPPLYPPLANRNLDQETIQTTIREGRGVMPAFPQLSDEEISDLSAYIASESQLQSSSAPSPDSLTPSENSPKYAQIAPFFVDPHGVPAIAPPWGALVAVDLNAGSILWKKPLGEYPHLVAKGIRNTGAKNFGGPVLTAGDLIFIAATPDEKIRAFDKYSGETLWENPLPAGGYATPCVYEIDGRQFVVIACGGGGKLGTRHGDAIVAFSLPK